MLLAMENNRSKPRFSLERTTAPQALPAQAFPRRLDAALTRKLSGCGGTRDRVWSAMLQQACLVAGGIPSFVETIDANCHCCRGVSTQDRWSGPADDELD